jgi:hypothetical protein
LAALRIRSTGARERQATIFSKPPRFCNRIVTGIDDACSMRKGEKGKMKIRVATDPEVHVYSVEDGYVAEGPGFYVWDEDWNAVIRAAGEFARGGKEIPATGRMLRIQREPDSCAAH